MDNFPQGLQGIDKDLFDRVWKIVQECGEEERHFNQLQSVYRGLASSWFLATVGAIGFLLFNKDGKLVPQNYLFATVLCIAGMAGFVLLWVLDLQVYHQLLKSAFHEGLVLEQEFPWLPRIRTNMDVIDKKQNDASDHVLRKLRLFYVIGTVLIGVGFVTFLYLYLRMYLGLRYWGWCVGGAGFVGAAMIIYLWLGTVKQPKLGSIEITPSNISLQAGAIQPLKAIGIYDDGFKKNIPSNAAWRSSDDNVASVSTAADGDVLVEGIAPGTAEIAASFKGFEGKAIAKVGVPVSITIEAPSAVLTAGSTQVFRAIGNYDDGSTNDLTAACTWSTSDPKKLEVGDATGNKGRAKAIAGGTADIIATFAGVSGQMRVLIC